MCGIALVTRVLASWVALGTELVHVVLDPVDVPSTCQHCTRLLLLLLLLPLLRGRPRSGRLDPPSLSLSLSFASAGGAKSARRKSTLALSAPPPRRLALCA